MKRLLIAIFAAFVLALYPVAAEGHTIYMYQGKDMGYVNSAHYSGGVADRECDGHQVYVLIMFANGDLVRRYDKNGCNNGEVFWTVPRKVELAWMCETVVDICHNGTAH